MKKMKKFLLLALSLLTSLSLFVACGDTENSSEGSSGTAPVSSEAPAEASEVPEASSEAPAESSEEAEDSSEAPAESSEEAEDSSVCENHTGGTATCKTLAKCATCDTPYGELDATNHESTEFVYVSNGDGTHTKKYACCEAVVETADCAGGTATCKTPATCDTCETAYGEVDAENHESTEFVYVSNGDGTHTKKNACCEAVVETADCAGGTATCVEGAVCDACETVYGEVDADNHVKTAETALWTTGEGEYEGFDVKACDCGHVFEAFDVTNETVGTAVLTEETVSVLTLVDAKFHSANVADILYNGESVLEQYNPNTGDLSTAVFGTAYGTQELSFVLKSSDGADHVGIVEVLVVTDVITTFDELQAVIIHDGETKSEGYYVLGNDIGAKTDVLPRNPATATVCFTLDGQGHSITYSTDYSSRGLFGYFRGVAKNVTFNVYEYEDSWASAGLAENAIGVTLDNVTYNVLSAEPTPVDYLMTGALVRFDLSNSTLKDVTINTMGVKVGSIFGSLYESKGANTMENVTVYATEYDELANTGDARAEETALQEIPGVLVIKPQTLAGNAQEILLTDSTYAISLGEDYEGATITSITYGTYDLGTNLSALNVPQVLKDDKQAHGEAMLTVMGTLNETAFILNVPVVFVTMEIGDVETFQNTITTTAHTQAVYGYYVLTADIGTNNDNCVVGGGAWISGWDTNMAIGFQGTLDGKNFKLHTLANNYWGLFTILRNATVKNLTITDGWYGGSNYSAIFGHGMFNSTIENVTIKQVGGQAMDGTGWFANGRVDKCTFKNVTIESSATVTKQISLFGTCFFAGNHANACTFENFVIKGFTIDYLGSNAHINGGTTFVMQGQTVEGKQCVVVPGISYATVEEA